MVKDDSADVKYIGYEDIGKYYSGLSLYEKISINEQHKKISQLIDGGVLLDLACGDGVYTIPFAMQGIKTISMDISDKMLSLLYKRAEIANIDTSLLIVCRANALSIPLSDASIDAVIANSVLHLISKPELVLNEIYRVLKAGGKFITFEDKPGNSTLSRNNLTEEEQADNKKFEELVEFIHKRYFQKLSFYHITSSRYSWQFDRDKICNEMFRYNESYLICKNNKIINKIKNTFLYRMGGKGFSEQSDEFNNSFLTFTIIL
jgi:ubiquinone/menaquinone biosynthesis C-methylase UbiE